LDSLKQTKKGRIRVTGNGFVVDSTKAKPTRSGLGRSAAFRSLEKPLHSYDRFGRSVTPLQFL